MTDATSPVLRETPPGPAGWPFVGSLFELARAGAHEFLLQTRRRYGTLASWRIGTHTFWLVSEPEAIEEVLLGQHRVMHKDAIYGRLKPLLGEGLVTSEDELWKRQRRLVSKPFAKKQVDGYATQMRAITERWMPRAEGVRDVYEDLNRLTEHVVLEVLFGVPADSTSDQVGPSIATWMEQFHREDSSILRLVPLWFPTPGRRGARRAEAMLDEIVFGVIQQKRRESSTGDDVLSRLMAAASEEEGGISDRQLRDEAVTLFVAGHETTALSLTWTLRQLALHPAWQDRVRAELREALPDGPNAAADAAKLPVLRAVLQESMRLNPPVWAIGREPQEDCVVGGRHLPRGTQIIVSQYVMHRDERWFPDPERWDPQRWLDGLEATLPRFVYLPFGGGPRVCIGNHFAMLEATVLLAVMLRDRAVSPVDGAAVGLVPSVTLRPDGPVRLRWSPV